MVVPEASSSAEAVRRRARHNRGGDPSEVVPEDSSSAEAVSRRARHHRGGDPSGVVPEASSSAEAVLRPAPHHRGGTPSGGFPEAEVDQSAATCNRGDVNADILEAGKWSVGEGVSVTAESRNGHKR